MIVDFHTHTFPEKIAAKALSTLQENCHTALFSDGTAAELAQRARSAGIDRCVVLPVATSERQVAHINDSAIRMNEAAEQTGIFSLGAMHPDFADWHTELGRLTENGIRGIKLHPPYQNVDMDDPRYLRILTRAGELGLFVLIHAGLDVGMPGNTCAVPAKVRRALEQAGPVTMVCAHMGGWRCWEEAAELLAPMGVYIDTAFAYGRLTPSGDGYPWNETTVQMLNEAQFLELIRSYGADRVLFGTDSPWADQRDALKALEALPLNEKDRSAILSENAKKLMGW